MRRLAFLSVIPWLAGAACAQDFDDAVLRGSSGFEPVAARAVPIYAADAPGSTYPIDADAAVAPAPPPGLPAAREFRVEIGLRYWYSSGSFAKNLFDDPRSSNNLNSRLTYGGLTGQSYEFFGRIDHASGFFLKGFVGLGSINTGTLTDEDFPPAIFAYSSTLSDQQNGRLGYATVDFGYSFLNAPAYRVGAFVGYNYMAETLNAYGCTQTAGNPEVCVPSIPPSVLGITEDAKWNSLRIGLAADVVLFDRLRLGGEAAWVPFTRLASTDTHWLRTDIFMPVPEQGDGNGVQLEAFASYQFTEAFSAGVGARYWRMQASGSIALEAAEDAINAVAQPGTFATDRFGVFAQAAYKFCLD
ncbi:MAG TPA: omptin family outer membrane protease [Xanthobacteraceae bacterium]|nr:omptin family outer membrane protease [Xanthobacteraceae bacterium]